MSAWWERQLGLPADAAAEKGAAPRRVLPDLRTFDGGGLPHPVPDPNRGFTTRKALVLEVGVETQLKGLPADPDGVEVQAFGLTPFCAVGKIRRMLTATQEYNRLGGWPGYTRFFV